MMNEVYEIRKGTKLYEKKYYEKEYKELEVLDVFLESYINGWKTIIRVVSENKVITNHFASELNDTLFTKIPEA